MLLFALSHTEKVVNNECNDIPNGAITNESRWMDARPKEGETKGDERPQPTELCRCTLSRDYLLRHRSMVIDDCPER